MDKSDTGVHCEERFRELFGVQPVITASAPGRLEVLGNHTDYNQGLALSCAVDVRCYVSIAPLNEPSLQVASTAFSSTPEIYPLDQITAPKGHWANYVLGIAKHLRQQGHDVPGLALLIDSHVPASAGLSSSAGLEMSVLAALGELMQFELSELETAQIGQQVESAVVGANTGLLDPLTALLGQQDRLLGIDFKTMATNQYKVPAGWCFVAVDSGVKHDLTMEYNDRRAACEQAAAAMRVDSLRDADLDLLLAHESSMAEAAWRCAKHVITENGRVNRAMTALQDEDIEAVGRLMFESHASSREDFRNSCDVLDELVAYAQQDARCIGARLSGGGFGGITIHLVREVDADSYLEDLLHAFKRNPQQERWGRVCRIDGGVKIESIPD